LKLAEDYMKSYDVTYLNDIKDGEYFRSDNCNLIPYVIFYDEVETGNPLGSRKGVHKKCV